MVGLFRERAEKKRITLAVDMDDAVRLNVAAVAVQVFIGGEFGFEQTDLFRLAACIGVRL